MDRRIEKTKRSIINAFLMLRSQKSLEKISIRELCELADINKSTFYTHYQDIYDLSEQLENQVAVDILEEIGHPESIMTEPEVFTRQLYYAYLAQEHLIHILFSGSRSGMLVVRIEDSLRQIISRVYPELLQDARVSILLTLEIYGQFYAFMKCRYHGDEQVIDVLSDHAKKTLGDCMHAYVI